MEAEAEEGDMTSWVSIPRVLVHCCVEETVLSFPHYCCYYSSRITDIAELVGPANEMDDLGLAAILVTV